MGSPVLLPAAASVTTTEIFWAFLGIQPLDPIVSCIPSFIFLNSMSFITLKGAKLMFFVLGQQNICLKL